MSQVCRQCSRVNPADASYCYFDGAVLAGHPGSGPVNAGSAPFPSQFVFPTGQSCKNFDQMALACQQNWSMAIDMLKQGFLGTFFGGLGRADLAMAAMEAAKFPDIDRGLDQLLSKLPTTVLQDPQLKAEPSDVNLGQVAMGSDRQSEIHLSNLGMRLLYGSVVSDCKWLTLGDAPGSSQKLFQFGAEAIIPVHVRGQYLRAGSKPLEGRLVVESNGGTATVTFRADVPVTPFKGGLFDGALTPRQVAEKAKANPKEAAPFFTNGAVAQWFTSNGWTYPVQGPSATGLGGVQQFFEALGLAKAPKVEINSQSLSFRGDGGQSLQMTIEVSSQEKKPVYAHAHADQPWIDCSKVKLAGNKATITIAIPRVPNRPGETLQAMIKVVGNGNQKFNVPMLLSVGAPDPNPPPEPAPAVPEAAPSSDQVGSDFAEPVLGVSDQGVVDQGEMPFADMAPASPIGATAPAPATTGAPPPLRSSASNVAALPSPVRTGPRKPLWLHLTPLALLFLALGGVLVFDAFSAAPVDDDFRALLRIYWDWNDSKKRDKDITDSLSFGLGLLDSNARPINKYLTYKANDNRGRTNSALVRIDGKELQFGDRNNGKWDDGPRDLPKSDAVLGGKTATFRFQQQQVSVKQEVKIIAGEAIEVTPGESKSFFDTCVVIYTIRNLDRKPRNIGFRYLLDTFIGDNDGSPFTIPGSTALVSTQEDFDTAGDGGKKAIPDFIQALEVESIRTPGIIAQLNLRVADKIEPPGRVSLTHYPGRDFHKKYQIPMADIKDDSAVVMYWHPADLGPGKTREIGFSYGLGNVASQTEKIGLTLGGSFVVKGEISVVALIAEAAQNPKATIEIPNGLTLLPGLAETQDVPPENAEKSADGRSRPSPVTWRLRADREGSFVITVRTSGNLEATRKITIKRVSIF